MGLSVMQRPLSFSFRARAAAFACMVLGGSLSGGCGLSELDGLTGGEKEHPLPLVVDQFFAPASWGAGLNMNAVMTPNAASPTQDCDGNPAPNAQGNCHSVTYFAFPNADPGGFAWLYPANNTGAHPGLKVAPGAKAIRFSARGAHGGESVGFQAGGIGFVGSEPIRDGFAVQLKTIVLTSDWRPYSLDMTGTDYGSGVLGAFGWQLLPTDNTAPVQFFLDDIVWE